MDKHKQHDKTIINRHFKELNPMVAGWQAHKSGTDFGPAIREFYVIHYILSGKGTFKNQNNTYTVEAGQYFLLRPGELTFYKADDVDPWHYIWIGFDGELAKHFDNVPDTGTFQDAQFFLDIMDSDDTVSKYEEYLTSKLFMLYYLFFCNEKDSANHAQKARSLIKRNYMSDLRVEDIAQSLGVNRIYLSRIFKKDYGIPIKQYIISTRMDHAKQFLESGYSVAEVADMVGYNDTFVFSKTFKRHFGISPITVKNKRKPIA